MIANDELNSDLCSGTSLRNPYALAYQISEVFQGSALWQNKVQVFGIEIGDDPQVWFGIALELADAIVGKVQSGRTGQARFHLTSLNSVHIVRRRIG